ncbi:TPA: RNA-binding protein [Bacillus thuringiensis]|uniref:RNA-binding protein n=1 Tax=Bacillus cereus group TaxID=86661 RepID=UPI0015A0A399|nr:RNA-binding protein [Bacillus thuringiensis]MCU5220570.1 RNA-binding protein [Bacillus cereus]MCC3976742.1 RNA-binding protein [Bacillus thuringiensis]MCC3995504.1 RNA-binding protein [Bacillus thuringiensis]MCC4007827.1 RNA-binding protein [Bacillus thuringiensis serovar kurstaki]MCU5265297.1 RNA-binding protein [Bacillus cereus]
MEQIYIGQLQNIFSTVIFNIALILGCIVVAIMIRAIKKLFIGDGYSYSSSRKGYDYSPTVNLNKSSYSNVGNKKSNDSSSKKTSSSSSSNSDYLIATSLAASSYSSYDSSSSYDSGCSSSSYDSGSSSSYDSGSICGFGD